MKNKTLYFFSLILIAYFPIRTCAQQSAFKAAFLYHFAEYINWKDNKISTFNFGVLEQSPITKQMQAIANEKKIKNKPILVKEFSTLDEAEGYQFLFVPANCSIPIESILSKYAGKPVLIVTEKEGFGKKGAHINFLLSDNRLRFEINLKSFNNSGVEVSSQLLQHAIIIE